MNPMGRLVILLLLAALFAGGALFAYRQMQERASREPDPSALGRAPSFQLTAHTGDSFDSASIDGRVWVVNFFFTRCGGICPILTSRMTELAETLEPYENWSLISISVDPEYDTPEVLTQYREAHGITLDNWHFLTGEKEVVWDLIRTEFLLPVQDDPGNEKEPVLHSPRVLLIDSDHVFRGFYDALDEDAMQGLKRDAAKLLQ